MLFLSGKICQTMPPGPDAEIPELEQLRGAVVLQAVKDWRDSARLLCSCPDHAKATSMKKDCERFFRSRWFCFWTGINGEYLLRKLKGEMPE